MLLSQGIDNIPHFHRQCLKNWNNKISNNNKINVIDKDIFLNMQNELKEDFFSFYILNNNLIWLEYTYYVIMEDMDRYYYNIDALDLNWMKV